MRQNFNVEKMTSVSMHGVGGRTINQLIKFDMQMVKSRKTDCVILMAGGNDVTEESSAEEVAMKIITFCTMLINSCQVRHVVICALTPRFHKSFFRFCKHRADIKEKARDQKYKLMYCKKAQEINQILKREVARYKNIVFWDHNGRFDFTGDRKMSCRDKFGSDGIHLNNKGQYHMYKSLRGAIINSCKKLRQ